MLCLMSWLPSLRCFLSFTLCSRYFCFWNTQDSGDTSRTMPGICVRGLRHSNNKGRGSDDSVSSKYNISSRDRNVLLLRCLHPSLDHEFMPFWQQLSTTNITILCLSFKVKYSAAFKCNAGAPTGPELSIR